MSRPTTLVELGVEAQAGVRECRQERASLYASALATRDYELIAEVKYLADILSAAERSAKRVTARAGQLYREDAQTSLWAAG